MRLVDTPRDGSCMLHAILINLAHLADQGKVADVYSTTGNVTVRMPSESASLAFPGSCVKPLYQFCVAFLRRRRRCCVSDAARRFCAPFPSQVDEFRPAVVEKLKEAEDRFKHAAPAEAGVVDYAAYLRRMSQPTTWLGEFELVVRRERAWGTRACWASVETTQRRRVVPSTALS